MEDSTADKSDLRTRPEIGTIDQLLPHPVGALEVEQGFHNYPSTLLPQKLTLARNNGKQER
jgi:hypothetical protein